MKSNQSKGGQSASALATSNTKPSNKAQSEVATTKVGKQKKLQSNVSQPVMLMPGRIQQSSHLAGSTIGGTINSLQIVSNNNNAATKQASQQIKPTNAPSSSATGAGTSTSKNSDNELLEVTVIPVDEQPYSKHVQIPLIGAQSRTSMSAQASSQSGFTQASRAGSGISSMQGQMNQYPSLKDLFQNSDTLWRPIFGSFVGTNKKPQFAIFRKPIERRRDIAGIKRDTELSLHILYLKRDITQFPRNAFANQIEVYCSKFFYGPLVVVFCDTKPPYKLHDFPPYYLIDQIEPLNEMEQKCYPLPFGAKRCSLVRALMSEDRFTTNMESLERQLSNHEFMLYCYKTSFCPISNSTIHDWSKCNYAHRQQDFRRPPYLFFYYPERCPHIGDDGSWEACEYELHCDYAHTLVEILFNPLHYKLTDCVEKTPSDRFQCVKHKERCCHAHSNEEKKLCNEVLEQLVPKVLPQKEDVMQYYLEMLPDYQIITPQVSAGGSGGKDDGFGSEGSPATTQATTTNNASGQHQYAGQGGSDHMNEEDYDELAAQLKMQAPAKKPKDPSKAAEMLQTASDLQRQKFMDVFTQMQPGPAALAAQKTYKVKSESKPVALSGTQPALLRPENPFSKVKHVVINPMADSPQNSEKADNEPTTDFRPFGDALSAQSVSPDKPTIFDKLDNKVVKNEIVQKIEKMEEANVAQIKAATAKADKRLRGKKGGKLVKNVVVTISSIQEKTTESNTVVTPSNLKEKQQREASLSQFSALSEANPGQQLPRNLLIAQSATVMKQTTTISNNESSPAFGHLYRNQHQQHQVLSAENNGAKPSFQRKQNYTNSAHTQAHAYLEESKEPKQSRPAFVSQQTPPQETTTLSVSSASARQPENKTAKSLAASISAQSTQAATMTSSNKDYQSNNLLHDNSKSASSISKKSTTVAVETAAGKKRKGVKGSSTSAKAASNSLSSQSKMAEANKQQSIMNGIVNPEEFADYDDLPQSAKESTEADIKMVKLQLLKHQMDSLQISQEDSDNYFYLQQISETREQQKDEYLQQQSFLVPLLSSRSTSPVDDESKNNSNSRLQQSVEATTTTINEQRSNSLQNNNNNNDNQNEEQIIQNHLHHENQDHNRGGDADACEEESKHLVSRPSRLKNSADGEEGEPPSSATTTKQQQQQEQNLLSSQEQVEVEVEAEAEENWQPNNKQHSMVNNDGPPEQTIYRQLASDYSSIEVADFFEATSMRLIALGIQELEGGGQFQLATQSHQRKKIITINKWNQNRRPNKNRRHKIAENNSIQQHQGSRGRQNAAQEEEVEEDMDINVSIQQQQQKSQRVPSSMMQQASNTSSLQSQSRLQPQVARQDMVPYQQIINARMTPTLPFLLEGLQHLQVTHNRHLGSERRGQAAWLYAFNWSLFVDPITVWNACEVRELAAARGCPNRQWLISFNNGTKMDGIAQLDAHEAVPSIIRHIWGLPLATSEGFGDLTPPGNPMYHLQQRQVHQNSNGSGLTHPVFAPSPTMAAVDSQTKQGAFRAPQQQQQTPNQTYQKGNIKTSRNSNQVSFQSSTNFSEQNQA